MNLNDKRVIQTRQKLRTALLTLMQRKPVSQITVKEICDEALTNRNTFYAHYGAPVDILVQIQQEYNEKMQLLRQEAIRTGDVQTLILGIMNTLLENRDFSMVLYGDNSDSGLQDRVHHDAYSQIMLSWIESGTKTQADRLRWLFIFLSGGIDSIIRTWVKNGMKEDPAQLAQQAAQMCNASSMSIFR